MVPCITPFCQKTQYLSVPTLPLLFILHCTATALVSLDKVNTSLPPSLRLQLPRGFQGLGSSPLAAPSASSFCPLISIKINWWIVPPPFYLFFFGSNFGQSQIREHMSALPSCPLFIPRHNPPFPHVDNPPPKYGSPIIAEKSRFMTRNPSVLLFLEVGPGFISWKFYQVF